MAYKAQIKYNMHDLTKFHGAEGTLQGRGSGRSCLLGRYETLATENVIRH